MAHTNSASICLNCLNPTDRSTTLGEDDILPQENDICICFYCGTVGKYQHNLMVRPMSENEIRIFESEYPEEFEKLQTYLNALKMFNK